MSEAAFTSEADFLAAISDDQADSGAAAEPSVVDTPEAGVTTADSFSSIDPNSLPEELQGIYKQMQGDYTRKTQDVASVRRLADEFGGVEAIQEGMQFVSSLRDPQALVQLHSELSEYLQTQGLTKAEADQAAASQIAPESNDEDYGFSDPNADALRKELDEIKAWRQGLEQERVQAQVEADLLRKEAAIRQLHPEYDDDDVNSIYQKAWAFGGDLEAAQVAYEKERQRILSHYMGQKDSQPSGLPTPTSGSFVPEQTEFQSFEDRHAYAKKSLQAALNQSERS